MTDSFNKFKSALERSRVKVSLVAAYFIRKGYNVQSIAPVIPETPSDCQADNGDLTAWKSDGVRHVIEVKGYDDYSSETLLGFPHILLDKKTTFDKKETRPFLYFIVGNDTDYALMFRVSNWDKCTIHIHKDQMTGNMDDCYVAEPKHFTRIKL